MFPIDAKVPERGSMKAMRTGSWAELALLNVNAAARLIASNGLRIGLGNLVDRCGFFISNATLFVVII